MQWHRNQHLKSQNDMLREENSRCKKGMMVMTVIIIVQAFVIGVLEWTV